MAPATNGSTWTGRIPVGAATAPIYSHGFVKAYVCPADPTNSTSRTTDSGWVGGSYACNFQVFGNPILLARIQAGDPTSPPPQSAFK
jgi:hypothetical protein